MTDRRSRNLLGASLIGFGALFLIVSNHVVLGWANVWPLFLILGGALLLRAYARKRSTDVLFAGVSAALLGAFLLVFALGIVDWGQMSMLWPAIPLIAGIALMAASHASSENGSSLVIGSAVTLFAAASFLLETGVINRRVATPFLRFWPLILVLAGIVILKARGKLDPDMDAVRELMDDDIERARGSVALITAGLESSILERVRRAPDASAAVTVLVGELKSHFPHFSWVGVYRMNSGVLTLGESDYTGEPPEHRRIELTDGVCGASASARRTIVVPDVCKDPRYLACSPAVKSEIVVPILASGELLGVLDIDSDELDAFSDEDRRFLESLVSRAAPLVAAPGGPRNSI